MRDKHIAFTTKIRMIDKSTYKHKLLLLAVCSSLVLFSACQSENKAPDNINSDNNQVIDSRPAENDSTDEITPINANDEEITPGPVDNSGEESTILFSEISRHQFDFLSGGGAWQTSLSINKDGTFRGGYYDSDIGDTGEGYPNGTMYSSVFEGKFTRPKKVNDYTYSMSIESIKLKQEVGREEIIDGIRYIYSEPYGLDGAKEIYIYTPQAPIKELPESYRSWVSYMDLNEMTDEHLSFYGLYNVETEEGFSSHVIVE